jgi:3-oxoacid CoA-transferase subunit A
MIHYFYCIGDTHGVMQPIVDWAARLHDIVGSLDDYGLIIMGDAGFNYYLNDRDKSTKKKVNNLWGLTIYCVRGNHEQRPELVPGMNNNYDENVDNYVYYEDEFMNIRYLMDGYAYNFNGLRTLVLGGAYSVDKDYRLSKGYPWQWFEKEQLSAQEMQEIEKLYTDEFTKEFNGNKFDVVMSHTCPFSWQPTDLFLSTINQTKVDNTMEKWMDSFKDKIQWKLWIFGHFHADRYIHMHPQIRMIYHDIEPLLDLYVRAVRE